MCTVLYTVNLVDGTLHRIAKYEIANGGMCDRCSNSVYCLPLHHPLFRLYFRGYIFRLEDKSRYSVRARQTNTAEKYKHCMLLLLLLWLSLRRVLNSSIVIYTIDTMDHRPWSSANQWENQRAKLCLIDSGDISENPISFVPHTLATALHTSHILHFVMFIVR